MKKKIVVDRVEIIITFEPRFSLEHAALCLERIKGVVPTGQTYTVYGVAKDGQRGAFAGIVRH